MNSTTMKLLQSGGFADVFLCLETNTCYKIFRKPGVEKREFQVAKYLIDKQNGSNHDQVKTSNVIQYFHYGYIQAEIVFEIYRNAINDNNKKLLSMIDSYHGETRIAFIHMEYVDGLDGVDYGIKYGYLNELMAIELMIATTYAVQDLHDLGLLHRDIKPDNLMFYKKHVGSNSYEVKLIDMGLSSRKPIHSSQSVYEANVIGTVRYLAPETLKGWHSTASDLYSIGLSFYILCGCPPDTSSHFMQHLLKLTDYNPIYRGSLADTISALMVIRIEVLASQYSNEHHHNEATMMDLMTHDNDDVEHSLCHIIDPLHCYNQQVPSQFADIHRMSSTSSSDKSIVVSPVIDLHDNASAKRKIVLIDDSEEHRYTLHRMPSYHHIGVTTSSQSIMKRKRMNMNMSGSARGLAALELV